MVGQQLPQTNEKYYSVLQRPIRFSLLFYECKHNTRRTHPSFPSLMPKGLGASPSSINGKETAQWSPPWKLCGHKQKTPQDWTSVSYPSPEFFFIKKTSFFFYCSPERRRSSSLSASMGTLFFFLKFNFDGDILAYGWGHFRSGKRNFISVASMLRKLAWAPLATVTRGSDLACCSFFSVRLLSVRWNCLMSIQYTPKENERKTIIEKKYFIVTVTSNVGHMYRTLNIIKK